MTEFIIKLISNTLVYLIVIYTWNTKKKKNIIIPTIIISILGTLINIYFTRIISILLIALLMIIINYIFFTKDIAKSITNILLTETITIISEMIIVIIFSILKFDLTNKIINSILNIFVAIIYLIIYKILKKLKIIEKIQDKVKILSKQRIIICFIFFIIASASLCVFNYLDYPLYITIIINVSLTMLYANIIFQMAYYDQKYHKIYEKYSISIKSLKEYENILNKMRVNNHENKNELRLIKNMIKDKEDPTNYINTILKEKDINDKKLYNKCFQIPSGGLRALIYSKICTMKELNIKYTINISREVKTDKLININDETMSHICKIVGVFIDNAIEYVKDKKLEVFIELYDLNDEFNIDISNKIDKTFNINNINKLGYTTKGKDHGYGLNLVDNLINEDKMLKHENEVIDGIFTQRLIINIKESSK